MNNVITKYKEEFTLITRFNQLNRLPLKNLIDIKARLMYGVATEYNLTDLALVNEAIEDKIIDMME
jgi:hypothetical protein